MLWCDWSNYTGFYDARQEDAGRIWRKDLKGRREADWDVQSLRARVEGEIEENLRTKTSTGSHTFTAFHFI